ncbi:MAG: hypothetical protein OXE83_01980, partial [Gammaproteobacteria bacterium]|nr:hypothetical protein [Gammaproteobacteria bacterium]
MAKIDKSALLTLREQFESVCPDFRTFDHPGEGRAKEELASRRTALDEVKAAVAEGETDQAIGKSVIEILQKGGNKRSPLVDVHTERKIKARHPQILGEFHTAIGRLVQSDQGTEEALQRAFSALDDLEFEGQRHKLSYG